MTKQKKSFSSSRTLLFVVVICFFCAAILSNLSIALEKPQKKAIELYRSKQLLISAELLSHQGEFTIYENGKILPATYSKNEGTLIPSTIAQKASASDILSLYKQAVVPKLTDAKGVTYDFKTLGIDYETYLKNHQKQGFAKLKYKLFYEIRLKDSSGKPSIYGYVIPINGFGLWDAIYGYLCLAPNADTVIGCTWYDQKETPGLGGEIGTEEWQKQFTGKKIFRASTSDDSSLARAPLGLEVVKSNVKEVYGNSPKAQNAVDGIAGATITITGVTESYKNSLAPYRPFLLQAHK